MSTAVAELQRNAGVMAEAGKAQNRIVDATAIAAETMRSQVALVGHGIESTAAVGEESAAIAQEVSASTEEQSAGVEDMSSGAQSLVVQSTVLKGLVGRFILREAKQQAQRELPAARHLSRVG